MSSKFESIWKLISKHSFEIDDGLSHDDLKCVICKKLMIDASQSSCGCHYCYNCINSYIEGKNKYCPGGKADCNEEDLSQEGNVFRNQFLNKSISNLKVHCPNQSCTMKIELINMDDHLRVCTKQPINCPYVTIGCGNDRAIKETIETHICDANLVHSELLMEYIQNLKNELDKLRQDVENKENRIVTLERELKEESQVQRLNNDDLRKNVCVMNAEREKHDEYVMGKMKNLWKIFPNIDADFVWRIEANIIQTIDKDNKVLFSESFNAHNYKLCLTMRLHGDVDKEKDDDDIICGCCVMRGENDDTVEWPMKQAVTINLISEGTSETIEMGTMSYNTFGDGGGDKSAFDRPINERNTTAIGLYSLKIALTKISDRYIKNGALILACVVNDP